MKQLLVRPRFVIDSYNLICMLAGQRTFGRSSSKDSLLSKVTTTSKQSTISVRTNASHSSKESKPVASLIKKERPTSSSKDTKLQTNKPKNLKIIQPNRISQNKQNMHPNRKEEASNSRKLEKSLKKSETKTQKEIKIQVKPSTGRTLKDVKLGVSKQSQHTSKLNTTSKFGNGAKKQEIKQVKAQKLQLPVETMQPCSNTKSSNSKSSIKSNIYQTSPFAESQGEEIWKYIPRQVILTHRQITINQFVVIRKIEEGSYFTDFMAWHQTSGCIFNLRAIDKVQVQELEILDQLCQAIKIHLYLSRDQDKHIGIQKLYAIFQNATNFYMVLQPLVSEKAIISLTETIGNSVGLPEDQIAYILKMITTQLNQIHNQGVIVRDITSSSLKNFQGVWKMVGLDKLASIRTKKRRNSFLGAVQHIPQELALGESYDQGYDMWNIGLLLFHMSTGSQAFSSTSFEAIKNLDFSFPLLVSSRLVDLLSRLIIEQPERFKCQACLSHSFLNREFGGRQLISRDLWSFWMN